MARHEEIVEKKVPAKTTKRKKVRISCDLCPKTINANSDTYKWAWKKCWECRRDCCPDHHELLEGNLWIDEDNSGDYHSVNVTCDHGESLMNHKKNKSNYYCKNCESDFWEYKSRYQEIQDEAYSQCDDLVNEWKSRCAARRVK